MDEIVKKLRNQRLHRINNRRFSIRLCRIAALLECKTVGKFSEKLLFYKYPQGVLFKDHVRYEITFNLRDRLLAEIKEYYESLE